MEELDRLVGEWSLNTAFGSGRVVFEWMTGGQFLIERWEVEHPDAPDGLAIIGFDEGRDAYLQHYFDSRGVARVYEMSLNDEAWELWRTSPDFSPLSFSQRFKGTFEDGGRTISGSWELSSDGTTWEHDFDLNYTRL